jgi:tetratricopeptide (TPR) repeat protein
VVGPALAVGLLLSGCAPGPRRPAGPVVSPTGIVYERGTAPTQTRFSQTAALYLSTGRVERALELAREGMEPDPANPIHYFLAGTALARLGRYEEADRMFVEAQRLYPAYELDVEPEREAAWAEAFNRGTEAYTTEGVEAAIEAWKQAAFIYDLRSEAHQNLARALAGEERYDEAIEVFQRSLAGLEKRPATRVLDEQALLGRAQERVRIEESLAQLLLFRNRFAEAEPLLRLQLARDTTDIQVQSNLARALSGQGRNREASEIYSSLLSEGTLMPSQLFSLGVAFFRSRDFVEAGQAFRLLTELQPDSRDAWFNYANSLFAEEAWESLATVADRLIELDPLNESAALIAARAHLENGDEEAALRGVQRIEEAPVHLDGLVMRPGDVETAVVGRIIGHRAEPGATVRLRFTFYGDEGWVGAETMTVAAPPSGESRSLEVTIARRATAYRYELVH